MLARRWIGLAGLLALLAACPATAADYPSRAITMIVPYAAGGPTDLVARIIGARMGKELGQQIVVENMGGAGGVIGATRVARAEPDGYTLLMHNLSLVTAPFLYKKHTYDVLKDFSPIALVANTPQMIVARKTMAAKSVGALAAYIKQQKTSINIADAGRGSGSYLCNLFFAHALGTAMTAVSYNGTGPALNDLVAGRVDLMCDQISNTEQQVDAGNIKGYCVTAPARVDTLPSVPTCDEAGLAHLEASVWTAFLGPAGLPPEVAARLASAVHKTLHDPVVVQRLKKFATTVPPDQEATPDGLKGFLKQERTKWAQTFTAMNVKPE